MDGLFNIATHILLRFGLEIENYSLKAAKVYIGHTSTLLMSKSHPFSKAGVKVFEGH